MRCKKCAAENRVFTPCEWCGGSEWEPMPPAVQAAERLPAGWSAERFNKLLDDEIAAGCSEDST